MSTDKISAQNIKRVENDEFQGIIMDKNLTCTWTIFARKLKKRLSLVTVLSKGKAAPIHL